MAAFPEEEDPNNRRIGSVLEMERLGESISNDSFVLKVIRFILSAVWQNLPEVSLSELYSRCIDIEDDNFEKVLWHFIVALSSSKNKNPSCLCKFVQDKSYKVTDPQFLYRILLGKIALELISNSRSCKTFINHVVTVSQLRDKHNYIPEDGKVMNSNYMMSYVLELFTKLDEIGKIAPDSLDQLRIWLEKKQLRKAAQLAVKPVPLVFRYSSCDSGKYNITSQKDMPSPRHEMESYSSISDFTSPEEQGSKMVKQCSEEGGSAHLAGIPKQTSLDEVPSTDNELKDFTDILKSLYKLVPLIADDQWPPVKEHIYVDLALIKSNNRPLVNDPNSFTRETIRGSVDDIYLQKDAISFDQVFVKSKGREIVLIDGRPGCGKTTLITKVTKDWAEGKILQNFELFVLVVLRQFRDAKKLTLQDILGDYFDDITSAVVEDVIRQTDGAGICIAFDGLDEYSSELFKGDNFVLNVIAGRDLKNATVYMTSRPATSNDVKARIKLDRHIEIIGFTESSKSLFIDKQFGSDTVKAEKLKEYLKKSPNIDRMCYLPLHLAMVIYLHEHDSGEGRFLPNSETELYYDFTIQTIYRDISKKVANPNDLAYDYELDNFDDLEDKDKEVFVKICKLAFEATVNQKQVYTGKEVKAILKSTDLRESSSLGLLVVNKASRKRALPTATYNFIHLTHQEFLAAVHLIYYTSESERLKLVKDHAKKEHMWVAWKFFCGLHVQKSRDDSEQHAETSESLTAFLPSFDIIVNNNLRSGLASLNMVHCAHESQEPLLCSSLLSKLKGELNVKDIKLHTSDCFSIGSVLVNAPNDARELDFSYCHFGPPGIAALVQPFSEKPVSLTLSKVHTLRLRARVDDKPIGYEGYQNLIRLIRRLPNLTELRLYGNRLTTHAFGHLSTAIYGLKQLKILILSRNHLDESNGVLLSIMLGELSQLQQFYISYNILADKGLQDMKHGLIKCKKLEILGLRGIGLTEEAGDDLAEIMAEMPSLNLLELYQNKLGNLGLLRLIPGLEMSQSLETISLVNNGIDLRSSDMGITSRLAECIQCNTTLKTLRLFYNSFAQAVQVELRSAAVSRSPELGLAL